MNKEEILQRIARFLILHSSSIRNIGLLNGKMGLVLFFMNYARYTKNKRYERFAGELIDEIYDEIHIRYTKDFSDGLTGIAWGIEYLIRNEFLSADPDEVLEDVDRQILEWDIRRVKDCSLENGLKGITYYVINRCAKRNFPLIFNDYIIDLIYTLKMNIPTDKESVLLIDTLEKIIHKDNNIEIPNILTSLVSNISYKSSSVFNPKRFWGLAENGYAGIGLKIMWEEQP